MFGFPLAWPDNVFCDKNWVVKNKEITESNLSQKHNVIKYHCVNEADAAGIMRVGKEGTATYLSDSSKKLLP